ncbi:MAG: YdeI/OmpD-associated family protein [Pseudomonadota bacterium]
MAIKTESFEHVEVASEAALWAWLEGHHRQDEAVWLVTYKKVVPEKYLATSAVLDALIAYGWVDGIRRKLDDTRTMQLIAPRKTQAWAASYKARADTLGRDGRMQPAGRSAVEAGKASGLWSFFDDVDQLIVPNDLAAALRERPPAATHFEGFAPSARRNILRWIKIAKTGATRMKRIAQAADLAQENRKPPQM